MDITNFSISCFIILALLLCWDIVIDMFKNEVNNIEFYILTILSILVLINVIGKVVKNGIVGFYETLLLVSWVISLITLFVGIIKVVISKGKEVTTERIELISLSFSREQEGISYLSFTVGYGSIITKKYFIPYQVNSDGEKVLCEMAENITVIYDTLEEDESPYAEIDSNGYRKTKAIRLYIPKHTIYKNIDLDQNNFIDSTNDNSSDPKKFMC